MCRTGSRGGRVDGPVGLGIQLYTMIRYTFVLVNYIYRLPADLPSPPKVGWNYLWRSIPARPGGCGGGGVWSDVASPHTPLSFPSRHFKWTGDGCCHLRGGGDLQVFTLAVLPAHPAKIPILAKNVTV